MDGSPSGPPLQLGQTLYSVKDAGFVWVPKDAKPGSSRYTGLKFSKTKTGGYSVDADAGSEVDLCDYSAILDSCAVNPPGSSREVLMTLERGEGGKLVLSAVESEGAGLKRRTPLDLPDMTFPRLIGLDPTKVGPSIPLLIVGLDGAKLTIWPIDVQTGKIQGKEISLDVDGHPVSARLVRHNLNVWLTVVVAGGKNEADVSVAAIPLSSLNPAKEAQTVQLPADVVRASVQTASLRTDRDSADQQLAICYATSAKMEAVHFDLVGFGPPDGKFKILKSSSISTTLAPPTRNALRIAAADLNHDAADELVVAWPARYGSVADCVCMALMTSDPTGIRQKSSYVVAAPGGQPLASVDFNIAAGLFGEEAALGILILAAGASFHDLQAGENEIFAGVIQLNPSTWEFPVFGKEPAVPDGLVSVARTEVDFFCGVAADLSGRSVVLGSGAPTQIVGNQRILAIMTPPPFEFRFAKSALPLLHFTTVEHEADSLHVSTNKSWITTKDFATNIGVGPLQLTEHLNKTYGKNFDLAKDDSINKGVTISSTVSETDNMLVMSKDYYAWEYPVFRNAIDTKPFGALLVVCPTSINFQQSLIDPVADRTFGYRQKYEHGCLPSYVGLTPDGYDPKLELFEPITLQVTDTGSKNGVVTPPSLTYDKGTSKTEAETKGTSLHTTLSDSAHLTSTKLFGYLPLPFGLNLTNAQSYSENEVKTGTLTKTPSLVISATMGSVDDAEYSYSVTTHVYFHKTLGCLTVAYSVALIGSGWARDYSLAKPMLIRPLRKRTDNVVLSAFSRAIRPFEQSGKVFIEVEIFNCSLRTATKVECTCYSGMPVKAPAVATLAGDSVTVPDDSKMIGKKTVEIGPTQRNTVTFEWTGAKEGDCVTAGIKRLSPPALGDALSDIGWNVYPERLYEKWNDDWGS